MSKFTEYIGSQFGNPHGFVGRICCVIMNVINKAMYKRTVSLIDTKSDDKVLDIGYGNGYFLKYLYKKTKSDLYGIDISDDMVKQATKKNKAAAKQIPFSALHFTRNLQEKNHSIYNHEISWIIKTWKSKYEHF